MINPFDKTAFPFNMGISVRAQNAIFTQSLTMDDLRTLYLQGRVHSFFKGLPNCGNRTTNEITEYCRTTFGVIDAAERKEVVTHRKVEAVKDRWHNIKEVAFRQAVADIAAAITDEIDIAAEVEKVRASFADQIVATLVDATVSGFKAKDGPMDKIFESVRRAAGQQISEIIRLEIEARGLEKQAAAMVGLAIRRMADAAAAEQKDG